MRFKLSSATALLFFLSFLYFDPSSSLEFSTAGTKPRIQGRQDGRRLSSDSHEGINEVLGVSIPKVSSDTDENMDCEPLEEFRNQTRAADGSVWIIDNQALESLDNDPQTLIQCTKPGDRVAFKLSGLHKFKRTLQIFHQLELFAELSQSKEVGNDTVNTSIFTCPESGPFLRIKARGFNASGFVVQNCTESQGDGAIEILSESIVMFEGTAFSDNRKRAIFVASNASLSLRSCYFERNGNRNIDGGAIRIQNDGLLSINSSRFYGNIGKRGGAMYGNNSIDVFIQICEFSGNNAYGSGGAIHLDDNNNFNVTNTTLLGNKAGWNGGAIYLFENNNFNVTNTTLSGNKAGWNGGAIYLNNTNTLNVINATLSGNQAELDCGAIYLSFNNRLNVINATLSGNIAQLDGGAIHLDVNNTLNVINTTLSGNQAENGGAISLFEKNNMTMVNCALCENKGKLDGGALSVRDLSYISISTSLFSGNIANQGGAIFSSVSGAVSFNQSKFKRNQATVGACFYGDCAPLEVQGCTCQENLSSKNGGCFYLTSSNATFKGNKLLSNHADNRGGGIYAEEQTRLRIWNTSLISNSANHGGGALLNGSRLLCVCCRFESNSATQGGGLYIFSNASQFLLGQLTMSILRGNKASCCGGGMVVKTFGIKGYDCTNLSTKCDRILLDGTRFIHNTATLFGCSVMGIKLDNVLVGCEARTAWVYDFMDRDMIHTRLNHGTLKPIDPKELCKSWDDSSRLNATCKVAIGTFAHKFTLSIDSTYGIQIDGNPSAGFILKNVKSGKPLPNITITTLDAYGSAYAPTLWGGSTFALNSSNEFLRKNYTIQIHPPIDHLLEATSLLVEVRECTINEESRLNMSLCVKCGEASYNFNLSSSEKCRPCPENTNCTTRYIKPKDGYWHKGPCHAKVKRCIVEKACKVEDKIEKLENLTRDFKDCNMTNEMLSNYSKAQCREGYEGPLCGSCEEDYGISSNLECSNCGHVIVIILRFFGVVVYLLIGTIITIKGVLPSNSSHHGREDVERPLLEDDNTTPIDVASSSQVREEVEDAGQEPSPPVVEGDANHMDSSSSEDNEVEVTKQKLISLNYFQVTSTAAGMDVEWTKKILDMLRGLNILGAATTDSISYSFDCLFSSSSNDSKAVWRLVFSLVVPLIVISLLSLHWGYRSFTKRGGDSVYFLRRLTLTVITVTYATYFDLTQVAMRTFSCVVVHADVDPFSNAVTRYWVGDTSLECYKNTHIVLICISLVVVMLVTIGFPTISSYTLNQHRSEVRDTSTWTHDTLGFLGGPFKQRFIYWECVTMIKKAMLSIIIVFSYSLEVQSQGLLILLVLVFFLYAHFLCYPYDEKYHSLNYYESGSLLVSCVTYTLIQFFNVERFSQAARSIVSLSIIAINVGFVCLMVYKIVRDLTKLLKSLLESQNIHISKNMNVISLIRVYSNKRRFR